MMRLSTDEIRRIAHLARLELSAEDEHLYAEQLAEVVAYIDQLDGWALDGAVQPGLLAVERSDEVSGTRLEPEYWLTDAPAALDRFVLVPQVKKGE